MNTKIKLVEDTIDNNDIDKLIKWLETYPKLTKGDLTILFEKEWSKWIGSKYSVFLNSGSSANLAAIYSLILSKRMKNKKIVVPAVSWVTTISPAIQLGLEPILCDCDSNNLGLDIDHLKKIIIEHNPAAIILVHVLGFSNKMDEIVDLCEKNNILLIEDTCESSGSMYKDKKLGTIGSMGTFSFYFGHHISTIEGGMISTDDEELYHILLSIRSHGWDRDLPIDKQKELRLKHNVNDFMSLYTFYYPGFNLRSTDLQAFLGLEQLKKIDFIVKKRNENFLFYQETIKNGFWKINPLEENFVSNMAYPIMSTKVENIVNDLINNNIECRPLICGSISQHPFWYEIYRTDFGIKNANNVHKMGLYVPNNHQINKKEIEFICDIINKNNDRT